MFLGVPPFKEPPFDISCSWRIYGILWNWCVQRSFWSWTNNKPFTIHQLIYQNMKISWPSNSVGFTKNCPFFQGVPQLNSTRKLSYAFGNTVKMFRKRLASFTNHSPVFLPNIYPLFPGWWLGHRSEKYESIGMMTFPIYGKIKNVPNHQPVSNPKSPNFVGAHFVMLQPHIQPFYPPFYPAKNAQFGVS